MSFIYLFSFVETPRKFIIAIINLRGVSTKLNKYICIHHANVQETYVIYKYYIILFPISILNSCTRFFDSFGIKVSIDEQHSSWYRLATGKKLFSGNIGSIVLFIVFNSTGKVTRDVPILQRIAGPYRIFLSNINTLSLSLLHLSLIW